MNGRKNNFFDILISTYKSIVLEILKSSSDIYPEEHKAVFTVNSLPIEKLSITIL